MSVTAFQDLALADRDRKWDGNAAEKRVREWAGAQEAPNQRYRDAHVWYDGLPTTDVARVKSHLAKYYKKMDENRPWERD